ncbi:lymphotoxin-alpha-like [Phycodurus eques]|uniref:lymphotoxin-alpha-like n=1 Tax=Phycodurus eques TaxID=693459 RepID=UPI002ACDB165|nr:lymphotoxin-alpha-like [Phycodurus eques]
MEHKRNITEQLSHRNTRRRTPLLRLQRTNCSVHLVICLLSTAVVVLALVVLRGGCPQSPDSQSVAHAGTLSSALSNHPQKDEDKTAMLTAPIGSNTNGKYLLWESKYGNAHCHGGFHYSNGSLVVPRKGMYRVFLQITYESKADFKCEGDLKLAIMLYLFSDTYDSDLLLLSSIDTINCSTKQWSKSLHTGGMFFLEANSALRVTSAHTNLISSKQYLVFFGAELLSQ